jgi:hypothetical protein
MCPPKLLTESTQSILWLSALARPPRFVAQAAKAEMIAGSDCAQVLLSKGFQSFT